MLQVAFPNSLIWFRFPCHTHLYQTKTSLVSYNKNSTQTILSKKREIHCRNSRYPGWISQRTLTRNPNAARTFCLSLVSTPLSFRYISSHSLTGASSPPPSLRGTPMLSHYCLDIQKFLGFPASVIFKKLLEKLLAWLNRCSPLNQSTVAPSLGQP